MISSNESSTHVTLVAKNLWTATIDVFDDRLIVESGKSLYVALCEKHNVSTYSHSIIDFIVWPM